MQPEGIVDVLRDLCEALAGGGLIVDLEAIRPSGRVEVDGDPIGQIDDTAFFARADRAVAGLDALVDEGHVNRGRRLAFDTLVHYDTGRELIAAIAASDERHLPDRLATRLADTGPSIIRERSLVRVFPKSSPRP